MQVLHFMGKLLGLTVTLVLELLHPPLDLLIKLLQFFNVVFKFFQQSNRHKEKPGGHLHTIDDQQFGCEEGKRRLRWNWVPQG